MLFLIHLISIITLLLIVVYSCILFTNAVEHLGNKLKLGSNAVGSILAVIGTTLPETLVPIVAIFSTKIFLNNSRIGQDIALGGIFGSPFMLCCLALFLIGIELIILYLRKKRDSLYLNIDYKFVLRDFKYFLCAYIPSISCLFIQNKIYKIIIVIFLIFLYITYVYRTIIKSKQTFCEECIDELIFSKYLKRKNDTSFVLITFQISISLVVLIFSIHHFVNEINYFSTFLNVSPVILSLIITPFATELPECINSLIWIKNKKDDLALFNVNGAIVFQAIVPMSIGIILTPFANSPVILLNAILVIISSLIFIINTLINKKVNFISLLVCGLFYFIFVAYLILTK